MAASQPVRHAAKAADQAVFGDMSGTRTGVRHGLLSIAAGLVLGACANLDVVLEGAPPTPTKAGVVFLFPGFNLPGDTYTTSGTQTLTRKIRSLGVRAEIDYASEWEAVAERYLAEGTNPAATPIAVVGYSLGAGSAVEFARKLGRAGVKVQTLVVVEPFSPVRIPGNVARALNIFTGGGFWSSKIEPEREFTGSLENFVFNDGAANDHWSLNRIDKVYDLVVSEVLDEYGVRPRWPEFARPAPAPRLAKRKAAAPRAKADAVR
jgi:pimeloyl-ACP methyl ester carboxylesterase